MPPRLDAAVDIGLKGQAQMRAGRLFGGIEAPMGRVAALHTLGKLDFFAGGKQRNTPDLLQIVLHSIEYGRLNIRLHLGTEAQVIRYVFDEARDIVVELVAARFLACQMCAIHSPH
jgi:hypothetical protein